jgi:hypothetical protein
MRRKVCTFSPVPYHGTIIDIYLDIASFVCNEPEHLPTSTICEESSTSWAQGKLIPILIFYSLVWELRAGSFSGAAMPVGLCLGSLAP